MMENQLTQEILKSILSYDHITGIFTRIHSGGGVKSGDVCSYVIPSTGYIATRVFGKLYTAHRLAWLYHYGEWPDGEIDHIDRCRTNNAISNLRCVTISINAHNTKVRSDNNTGYKGVYYYKSRDKYWAYFCLNNKRVSLGYHETAEMANEAVINAKRLHGLKHT
ncbi:HNH endonuclease [Salmonella enterica]|nr:HNH endonuclease [Salmonella enterica subsp. enterica serovar Brunei]EAX3119645.1 HNH endonuclease [Salmonella enterica]EEC0279172.1 HNH endonuclease [Salmonella enterica subsp. enterica]EGZ3989782.1 HNH endonuclease [Salmonella enterica subsp. enterica serovar Giza]EAY4827370.1 HNH endonuclease [Salmonella enterica]